MSGFCGGDGNCPTGFCVLHAVLINTDKILMSHFEPERIFEDHENLVENLLNWTRDSQNKLIFMERIEKYALFKNPQVRLSNLQSSGSLNVCHLLACNCQVDRMKI